MRTRALAAIGIAGALWSVGTPAWGDALSDCRTARDPRQRLEACGAVIVGGKYLAAEKATAFRLRGAARLAAGALDMALADLTEAMRLAPANAQAALLRAQARVGLGDLDGALADFTTALKVAPGSAFALNGRGHVHMLRGNLDLAVADFSQAIALGPQSASAYNNRGLAYRRAGQMERAIADYTRAIALNPIYALAYNNRGYAHEALGRKAAAVADYRRALLIDPSLIGAKQGLARLKAEGEIAAESARVLAEGRGLVTKHCAACHAIGSRDASPNPKAPPFRTLHKRHPVLALREPLTRGIAAPHDVMPRFVLPDADVDKIIAFINSLDRRR
ncbi:MAG: tetratricopeptide repeat protein [Hyphomicrobiaceae bacterium]|nr:tetratricopeptide repeat protein [Hyphomicrobiaceae bacterium]